MNEVYYLLNEFNNQGHISGLFLKQGKSVHEIFVQGVNDSGLIKYYTRIKSPGGFQLEDGETLKEAYKRSYKKGDLGPIDRDKCEFIQAQYKPGEYNPRIRWPIQEELFFATNPSLEINQLKKEIGIYREYFPMNEENLIFSINQLAIFSKMLNTVFQTVHPAERNLNMFGHEIRNLLILICTEIESQWRGIYVENSKNTKRRLSTKDYVKLHEILKLNDYSVTLSYYPCLANVSPFKNWSPKNSTESIPWYDRYNDVKHDRENKFYRATLQSVIESISALAILIIAQYGDDSPMWKEQLGRFFYLSSRPEWKYTEYYIPPLEGAEWMAKEVDF